MKRREFFSKTAVGVGAAWVGSKSLGEMLAAPAAGKFAATDIVTLGSTGIKTSRLAMGTGTVGYNHHSNQTALGVRGLADLLYHGYDNGLRFFDVADSYGSHPHAREALKRIPREKVTILTKSWARDYDGMKADIVRFQKELGTEYLDIALMHCLEDPDWVTKYKGAQDALSEFKDKGVIRAHGCSCHSIGALRAAAANPWVEVDLARINPISSHMDADSDTVGSVLREMKSKGKAVIGMKILGQGDMRTRQDEALHYALSRGYLDAFTIGAESIAEQRDLMQRIAGVSV